MDADEVRRKATAHEVGMPIDTMSVGELEERIGLLEGEIARLRDAIAARLRSRSEADTVFRR